MRGDRRRHPTRHVRLRLPARPVRARAAFAAPNVWSIRDAILDVLDRRRVGSRSHRARTTRAEWKSQMWELEQFVFPHGETEKLREVRT